MTDYTKRIDQLEGSGPRNPFGGTDLIIRIVKTKTICDGETRRHVTLAAKYPPIDWRAVRPTPNGDRIVVLRPLDSVEESPSNRGERGDGASGLFRKPPPEETGN